MCGSCLCSPAASRLSSTDVVLDTLRGQVARVQAEEEGQRKADAETDEKRARIVEEIKVNKLASGTGGAVAIAGEEAPRKKKASVEGAEGLHNDDASDAAHATRCDPTCRSHAHMLFSIAALCA